MGVKTATVIGSTGLIGSHIVTLLEADNYFQRVRLLVRRPVQTNDPKTEAKLIDFNDRESFKLGIDGSDIVFCAVGTTQKKVKGDKSAYRKVDHDIPVNAALFCKETNCFNFAFVSSVGANSQSKNFYLQLKGEVEDAIKAIKIPCTSVFRPSMLLGNRKEFRFGEVIGQPLMQLFSFALAGKWRKYKPAHANDVARAMVNAAKQGKFGYTVYEYDEI
ncbi:MAG TPA: NAD(P)H-binding protein, partial [Flavisolibacter sp.]|nr:NAD(P)H-binding protein [Flavisolibacter sp.]